MSTTENQWKTKAALQRDMLIDRWIQIASDHGFGYSIGYENTPFGADIVPIFRLAVEWSKPDTDEIGIDWIDIRSSRELFVAMGY